MVTMRFLLLLSLLLVLSGCYTCEESIRRQYVDNSISGTVLKKEHMKEGRKAGYLDIKESKSNKLLTIGNDDETGLVEITEIGDSLYKEKGDHYLYIYRNGKLVKKYDVWNECKYAR